MRLWHVMSSYPLLRRSETGQRWCRHGVWRSPRVAFDKRRLVIPVSIDWVYSTVRLHTHQRPLIPCNPYSLNITAHIPHLMTAVGNIALRSHKDIRTDNPFGSDGYPQSFHFLLLDSRRSARQPFVATSLEGNTIKSYTSILASEYQSNWKKRLMYPNNVRSGKVVNGR